MHECVSLEQLQCGIVQSGCADSRVRRVRLIVGSAYCTGLRTKLSERSSNRIGLTCFFCKLVDQPEGFGFDLPGALTCITTLKFADFCKRSRPAIDQPKTGFEHIRRPSPVHR